MKQLNLLEAELKMLQENIDRVREYQKDNGNNRNYNSHVVGELKHRATALKTRLTLVSKITTSDLWK